MTEVLLTPALIDGEFRILDTDLAKRLGFERPRDIRKLITRWKPELERMGICAMVSQNHASGRGRPTMEYYLNRKQAIFITAKSETPEATDITIEIIHRFDEYEVGRASIAQQSRLDPPFNTKTHDEWSMEEMRVKIAEVKLYTSTMTPSAGAWMLERLGFPMPPVELLPDWMRQRDMFSSVPPGSVTITVTPDRTDH
ncbi:Rha family transcriptional regulator [Sphingobium sp. PNB]|uniref:Rha family transcriptional regulator n=1 Tax=Sphingobium sp. PNB TaxID=863934 RepID=UPI001CA44C6F|nr:Rha family transcriptional regulator [Sphingobium sp. PNB]MCB4862399.1 Rha family transcriptional regulator [Sphingobium sp. PNB]